jgi:hypothetical protein
MVMPSGFDKLLGEKLSHLILHNNTAGLSLYCGILIYCSIASILDL